jgi:DNA-directed RNA polymerase subunit delta
MSNLTDRASFLRGLAQGMQLNKETNEGKLISEIIDVLGEMAKEMEKLQESYDELNEYVESIDDDLADMEEVIFGDEDDEEDGEEECGEECEGHDDEEENGETISYACPHCGHEMEFNAGDVDFDEDVLCPACKKPVFPEYEPGEDDDEDDDDDQ